MYDKVCESAQFIKEKINTMPTLGIILGSGLGKVVDEIQNKVIIPYSDIPHFPQSNVTGHADQLIIGNINDICFVAMSGRFHYYEGFSMKEVTYPIYVLKMLGVQDLIVTNACGGINTDFTPGDLMIITDFINLLGINPLIGENDERFGPRFPDMSEPYSNELIQKAKDVADSLNIKYQEGVYALFNGPCFETAAEIRAFKVMGADAVGMSTVPETTVANYLGMRVLGISCVTNMATGIRKDKHSHEEVLRIANESSDRLSMWLKSLLTTWNQ